MVPFYTPIVLSVLIYPLVDGGIVTLDLSAEVDASKVVRSGYRSCGVAHFNYKPNIDTLIVKVVDSGKVIWKTKKEEKCSSLSIFRTCGTAIKTNETRAIVYLTVKKKKGGIRKQYYQLLNEEWKVIPYLTYLELFAKALPERQLDVSAQLDVEVFKTVEQVFFGVPVVIYMSFDVFRITNLLDGNAILWRAKGHESLDYVIVHLHNESPKFIQAFVKLDYNYKIIYFEKRGETWALVTKEVFFEQLEIFE
ncbi:hypothetical protein BEWA_028670 [Theileria equi strain WA]|uniref:Signal peptide containing protein n=1 Tax=Theileria equi strain WA TaxID=1537102 RepID=L0AWP8_THEEQ|nr:hypothetical protein BEWA_028670 [Theileria equi strain WA]AFZ80017.1 hypothetical protein BEWA_028670 [Theileria equi strain WA]|eukprot:XP_004829683.1 hypothetical protein BEWA_028670 [Theileria equi strain WA]